MARFAVVVLCLLLSVPLALAQTVSATSPQAQTVATQAMAALTRGLPIADATLNANVTWIAGSDNLTGTGTFQAKEPPKAASTSIWAIPLAVKSAPFPAEFPREPGSKPPPQQ